MAAANIGLLAGLDYEAPPQDLTISLRRVPARPASGFRIAVPLRERGRGEKAVEAAC